MKAYSDYKKTGQLWLATAPSHWEIRKIKYAFSERVEKGFPDEQLLVSSQDMGVVPKSVYGNRTVEAQKDLHLLKLVREGDFVISLRSFQGGIEYAYYQGIISPAYTIMINNGEIVSKYFKYLAKSQRFIELLQMCVTGIREGQNIDYKKLKNFSIPIPPREEQDQIVRFLDWKVSEINRLINIKRKEIARLEELKKAVVSCRLSGEKIWLKRLLLTPLQYGANSSGTVFNSKLPRYVRITDIDSKGQLKNDGVKSIDTVEATPYILENGDVLLARSGATVGKAFMYKPEHGLCAFAGYLIRAKLNTNVILPEYFLYFTESLDYSNWKDGVFIQATIQNISAERYNKLPVPVPSIEEQQQIVTYLDEQTKKINTAIANKYQQLQTMQELKTRLISDVVTGKMDVSGIEIPEYVHTEEEFDKIAKSEEPPENCKEEN